MDMQLELFPRSRREKVAERRFEHRYYFAILPPPDIAQQVERWARELARQHRARDTIRAERLHVSLHGVLRGGMAERDLLDEAIEVGDAIRRPSFELSFDTLGTFGRAAGKVGGHPQRPTVLSNAQPSRDAAALFADIRREMQRRGLHVEPNSYAPHMTVWYGPELVAGQTHALHRPFRWPVRRFWLIHTTPGARRPECLGEWALSG